MKLFLAVICAVAVAADRLDNTYLPPNSAKTAGGNGNFLATPFKSNNQFNSNFNKFSSTSNKNGFTGTNAFAGHNNGFPAKNGFAGQIGLAGRNGFAGQSSFAAHNTGAVHNSQAAIKQYNVPQSKEAQVRILKFNNDNNGDGSYSFEFETENKISQQEAGQPKSVGSEQPTVVQGSYSYISPEGEQIIINYVADENGFQPIGDHLPTPPPIPEAILKSIQQNAAEDSLNTRSGASGASHSGDDGQYHHHSGSSNGPSFGAASGALNRQYLAPKSQPSFNQKDGYRY